MKIQTKLLLILSVIFLNSCFLISPPPIFADFDEKQVVGPGTYEDSELRWSFDGKYLAYVDSSGDWSTLGIYNLSTNKHRLLSETDKIAWHPDERISYLRYVPNSSFSTYPIHNDLHIVDPNGENDQTLIKGLGDITNFIWLGNGKELLLVEAEDNIGRIQNIYKLNIIDGKQELFIDASELGALNSYSLALSPNEKQLLIWTDNPCEMGRGDCVALVLYDMNKRKMTDRILGSELTSLTVEKGGVYSLNPAWINNNWIATRGHAILNEQPYLSLAFINSKNTLQSFEIEAEHQFGGPILSPDLAYIAYINVNRGPHTEFITISKTPQDIIDKLMQK